MNQNGKISGYSMRIALAVRFSLIFAFLAVFLLLIFACLTSVRAVKEVVASENVKKVAYFQAAINDPNLLLSLDGNIAACDKVIDELEAELDDTVNLVMAVCIFNVICLTLVTINTSLYVKTQVTEPILFFKDEVAKMAVGDLKLDFSCSSHALEIQELSHGLAVSTSELNRIVTVLNVGVSELTQKKFIPLPPAGFPGDFRPIELGFSQLVDVVADTLKEIVTSAGEVTLGAHQVSQGAQSLAHGATEQATSVEQLSDTVEDIGKMVADTAESAKEANHLGETANTVLTKSAKEMGELMEAISQIERSSADIEQIIHTIDEIAFQTNILALNAAIEAARAGQFGKSFAVVADEVRDLAQKSAVAAANTNELIEGSLLAIRRGATLARSTDKAFAEVKKNSDKMLGVVQHIAESSQKQSENIDSIYNSVTEISAVISNNSATSEESAAASEELSSQAESMTNMLDSFTLFGEVDMNIGGVGHLLRKR